MDCTVHGVAKSQTELSNFYFTAPGNHPSTFPLSDFDYSKYLESNSNLSCCDRIISLSIIYSRFIPVTACLRISFLFKAK